MKRAERTYSVNSQLLCLPNIRGQGISRVAFKNTDGSLTLVAFNHQAQPQKIQVQQAEKAFTYEMEAGMLVSFQWKP